MLFTNHTVYTLIPVKKHINQINFELEFLEAITLMSLISARVSYDVFIIRLGYACSASMPSKCYVYDKVKTLNTPIRKRHL